MKDEKEMALIKQLFFKVNLVGQELGAVAKDGKNTQGGGYNFISYENVNSRLRNLLPKHNLALSSSVASEKERDFLSKGKNVIRTTIEMEFILTDVLTGYQQTLRGIGSASDYGDKSSGKAITEAHKRFVFKLFHVSSFGDIDADKSTVTIEAPDVMEWMKNHKDLCDIASSKKLTRAVVQNCVEVGGYHYESVLKLFQEA